MLCGRQTDRQVLVQFDGAQHWLEQSDITLDVGDRVFPVQLDYEAFPALLAREEEVRLSDLQMYRHGDLLSDSQLLAGIREMSHRLSAGGLPDSLTLQLPAELKVLLQEGPGSLSPEAVSLLQDTKRATLLLAVVQSQPPRHWSLLALERQKGSQQVEVRYYDTLPSQASYNEASAVLKVLLQVAKQEHKPLPAPVSQLRQSDGFSCGLWLLLYLEKEWRQWLGESPQPLPKDLHARTSQLNRWLQCLLRTRQLAKLQQKGQKSDKPGPPPEAPKTGSAEQPDLSVSPPGSGLPAAAKTDSTDKPDLSVSTPGSGLAPAAAKTGKADKTDKAFGCDKCGFVLAGCMLCNKTQFLNYKASQEAKAKAEAKAEAKAKAKAAALAKAEAKAKAKAEAKAAKAKAKGKAKAKA